MFSHDLKSFPCKYYHALGYCDKGANCLFSHVAIRDTNEMKKFIETNADFLKELVIKIGRTNMDEFYFKYCTSNTHNIKEGDNKHGSQFGFSNFSMIPNNADNKNISNNNFQPSSNHAQFNQFSNNQYNSQMNFNANTNAIVNGNMHQVNYNRDYNQNSYNQNNMNINKNIGSMGINMNMNMNYNTNMIASKVPQFNNYNAYNNGFDQKLSYSNLPGLNNSLFENFTVIPNNTAPLNSTNKNLSMSNQVHQSNINVGNNNTNNQSNSNSNFNSNIKNTENIIKPTSLDPFAIISSLAAIVSNNEKSKNIDSTNNIKPQCEDPRLKKKKTN